MKITVSGTVFTSYDVKAKNNSKNEIKNEINIPNPNFAQKSGIPN